MQIEDVSLTPIARTISGSIELTGTATIKPTPNSEVHIPLSQESMDTIRECVERDYATFVRKLQP